MSLYSGCISVLGSYVWRAWWPQGPEITVLVSSVLDSIHGNSSVVLRICSLLRIWDEWKEAFLCLLLFSSIPHSTGLVVPFPSLLCPPVITSLKGMCLSSGVGVCFHFHNKTISTLWNSSEMLSDAWSKCKKEIIENVWIPLLSLSLDLFVRDLLLQP